ncbi:hypothetical protein GCM10012275_13850 [Longimycelium tulufanense]|uniref:Uncharacterized protein n=1 Tax=Longimycelium tulufanense TaxID=907463 RepID=A0A8J3C6U5_9PSEU|nr:hypothetical protein GCM10012275_13850 [Longimycelium tulufanense]
MAAVEVGSAGHRARVGEVDVVAAHPRELRRRLSEALYEILHTGQSTQDGPPPRVAREPELEERFLAAMPHARTRVVAPLVSLPDDDGGTPVVEVDGVRVRVPVDRLAGDIPRDAGQLADVELGAARPTLSPGFFLARGSRGSIGLGPILRIYVHLKDPDTAVEAWAVALRALEMSEVRYQAKVLSSPVSYPRRDGLVIYLPAGEQHIVHDVTSALGEVDGLGAETSCFAERMAPGIAIAWEPADERPGMGGLSFGQHRAAAIAEGLLSHAQNPEDATREVAIATAMVRAGIDPANPSRNVPQHTTEN